MATLLSPAILDLTLNKFLFGFVRMNIVRVTAKKLLVPPQCFLSTFLERFTKSHQRNSATATREHPDVKAHNVERADQL